MYQMVTKRILLSYAEVDIDTLEEWLNENNVEYEILDSFPDNTFVIEVYGARNETAVRAKWNAL